MVNKKRHNFIVTKFTSFYSLQLRIFRDIREFELVIIDDSHGFEN